MRDWDNQLATKSKDPQMFDQIWMQTITNDGNFTYNGYECSSYYAFSTKWQLDELRRFGDVFCFDIAHKSHPAALRRLQKKEVKVSTMNIGARSVARSRAAKRGKEMAISM
jgi:hypothetical protein